MVSELLRALMLIFVAEMGDKTQILALAFATQYKAYKVLLGVFIGSLLNHGLAVAAGSYLTTLIPISTIQVIAGISFIGFAFWTLKSDKEEEEGAAPVRKGAVITVATAFFIGELGDKTQLTAMTLAASAEYPLFVLAGTVLGMIVTSSLGIWVGSKIANKVPKLAIKLVSAGVFIVFGLIKLYTFLPPAYLTSRNIVVALGVLAAAIFLMLKPLLDARRRRRLSTEWDHD